MTFSILSVVVLGFTESSVPLAPNVQFQQSADERIIYHAGGDTLYMGDLEFRDRNGNIINELPGIDGADISWRGQPWSTGQYIAADDEDRLIGSIIMKDAKGNSFVLYRSSSILMDGSMVTDEIGAGPSFITMPGPVTIKVDDLLESVDDEYTFDIPFENNMYLNRTDSGLSDNVSVSLTITKVKNGAGSYDLVPGNASFYDNYHNKPVNYLQVNYVNGTLMELTSSIFSYINIAEVYVSNEFGDNIRRCDITSILKTLDNIHVIIMWNLNLSGQMLIYCGVKKRNNHLEKYTVMALQKHWNWNILKFRLQLLL